MINIQRYFINIHYLNVLHMKLNVKHLLCAAVVALTGFTAVAQNMGPIPVDPEVRTGKLTNGLTYYVRHNSYPEHRVNFYIAQRVGSLQEEESQRGLAHFLEHMAFNGSDHYPGNGVIDFTRTLGVEFGRDLNAYTSIDKTVYNINDVPSTRQGALDSCLLILKDWSNGLLLEDKEIDKERGVIHEEWRLRRSATQRIYERNLETLYPGSKYGRRMPIGLMSVVDGFKYQELRDYYHKWYRPDNQAIIVVGDIDVDHTEAKIKELFEGIPVDPNAPKVVDEPVPDNEQAIVVVDQDKEQQYSIAMVMFKHEAFPREMKSDMMYMMYDYMTDMVADMLNQRLKEKAQDADCPFIQAGGGDGNYLLSNNMGAFTFYALPKEGMTEQAVQAMLVEAHRAAKFGFTATEYDRARNDYMSRLEDAYNNRDKVSNESYGRAFASNYLENEPIASVEQEYEIMKQITPMVPVEVINQLLPEFISEGEKNLVVLNMNQEKEGAVYPTVEGLKGAIATAAATPIEAYVDNVKNEPLIAKLPKPGKIVKETKNNVLGFTELTLSNGVKVILKQTDFKADEIKMFADSKGGSSLYDEKDWANTELFDAVLATSGLGEFDNTELEKALAGKQASASLSLSTSYERLSGESSIKDLETMFQLTHLLMTDVRKDEKATGNLMTLLGNVLKNKSLKPEAVFSDSLNYTLGNHNWRDQPFNVEALDKVNIDRVLQIAKERTANAADFTFYFVGSFDNDTIRKHICQYIATLPASKKRENYRNVAERPVGVVTNHFTRDMETPKAIARMYWYSTTEPYSVAADVKANMVGQVLDKVYLQKIREDAGAAYSASARGGQQRVGDKVFTQIFGVCPMKPAMAETALAIMQQEFDAAASTIDAATLQDIKSVMIKDYDTNVKENNYWVGALSDYVSYNIDIVNGYKDIVNGISTQDLSDFVRNVVRKAGNKVEVVMMPTSFDESEGKETAK